MAPIPASESRPSEWPFAVVRMYVGIVFLIARWPFGVGGSLACAAADRSTVLVTRRPATAHGALDAGLLVLRLGAAGILGLLYRGGFPYATVPGMSNHSVAVSGAALLAALTAIGFATRVSAAPLALAMACSAAWGTHQGQQLLEEPVRGLMLAILYGALALTGAGRWSLDHFIASRQRRAHELTVERATTTSGGTSTGVRTDARTPQVIESGDRPRTVDLGLLLLRLGTGLSLFLLFGLTKAGWVIARLQSAEPWNQWGFAKLIADMGFPAPLLFAIGAVLNETVTPSLVAAGLATRVAAGIGAIGFGGAFYTSLRLGEEPLRAATYLVAFATIALTGAGRYSIDHVRSGQGAMPG